MKQILTVLSFLCSFSLFSQTVIDFTIPEGQTGHVATHGTNAQVQVGSVMCMWAGDANGDGSIIYGGIGTDVIDVYQMVINNPENTTGSVLTPYTNIYDNSDCNLDGEIIYGGVGTEVIIMYQSVINNPSNATGSVLVPVVQQIPSN